jgi:hypothetical protein
MKIYPKSFSAVLLFFHNILQSILGINKEFRRYADLGHGKVGKGGLRLEVGTPGAVSCSQISFNPYDQLIPGPML